MNRQQLAAGGSRVAAQGEALSPVRAGEMKGVAQRRLVFVSADARHAGGGDGECETVSPGAEPGRVRAHDRVQARERGAGEKGGFRLCFQGIVGSRPGGKRRDGGECDGWDWRRIGAN